VRYDHHRVFRRQRVKLPKQESPCLVRSAVKPSACENVAKKSRLSVTFEKKVEVIRRTEDGQTHRNVCVGVELLQSAVGSKVTSVDMLLTASHSRS